MIRMALSGVLSFALVGPALAAPPAWRVDAAASQSTLSKSLKPWQDQALVLTYRPDSQLWLSAAVERWQRFGFTDKVSRIQIVRTLDHQSSVSIAASRSPNAAVRPTSSLQFGYSTPQAFDQNGVWRWGGGFDLLVARYHTGQIRSFQPYVLLSAPHGIEASLKLIETWDVSNHMLQGYLVAAEAPFAPRARLRLSYADAPESDSGHTIGTQSVSGTLSFDANDLVTVRVTDTFESRELFDRNELGISLTRRF